MFVSIIFGSTPLDNKNFALAHKMTVKSLNAIGDIGGPRCCKRESFLATIQAVEFIGERFGIEMDPGKMVCSYSAQNNQYIGKRCPFSIVNNR